MIINFDIYYTDEKENYYSSKVIPGYLIDVFASLRKENRNDFESGLPLNSKYSFEYCLAPETTLRNLLDKYLDYLGFSHNDFYFSESMVYLKTTLNFARIEKYDCKIKTILQHYKCLKELTLVLVFSALQGEIWREGKVRYYMNSHEACQHNLPHVHVIADNKYEVSISLIDIQILAGYLPPKYKKEVFERVKKSRLYLLDCWNKMTDGIQVDINYGFGLTCIRQELKNSKRA